MKLKDKVAVITGAAQGIGAAFAFGFAREGAKIVVANVQDGKGNCHRHASVHDRHAGNGCTGTGMGL
ncbi:MAG: SDR family NAD(P)-dependent oxidoreductase [Deltaproteobacteria bacterium]|nr:SDR family NAD(P)-dependent oxidoreductase [Deltaproteobacteria bacterium]MBW2066385.1 SDR family NAD(P)-dependent oxidoreductase [Deltaproteobacteria bacterium]